MTVPSEKLTAEELEQYRHDMEHGELSYQQQLRLLSEHAELTATVERVRAVVSSISASYEHTSMYLEEAGRKQSYDGILRCSSRKACLEQTLEQLRAALQSPSPEEPSSAA